MASHNINEDGNVLQRRLLEDLVNLPVLANQRWSTQGSRSGPSASPQSGSNQYSVRKIKQTDSEVNIIEYKGTFKSRALKARAL